MVNLQQAYAFMQFTLFLDRLSGGAEVVRAQHWSASLLQVRDQPHKRLQTPLSHSPYG